MAEPMDVLLRESAWLRRLVASLERGIPRIDEFRPGKWSQTFGLGYTLQLAPGWYTAEIFGRKHRSGPIRFQAAPDATAPIEMESVVANSR